ncbi:MAG: ImmA/IrrE family metallo-endopeptidase [Pirellulales bacterium]
MARIRKARAAARTLISKSPKGPPTDLAAIAKILKAQIELRDDLGPNVAGVLIPLPERSGWVIAVNGDDPESRRRFTIAHEIGHIILHGYTAPHADGSFQLRMRNEESATGTVDEEIEANQFAAELLLPADLLLKDVSSVVLEHESKASSSTGFDDTLAKLAAKYGVSRQALALRLSALGVL